MKPRVLRRRIFETEIDQLVSRNLLANPVIQNYLFQGSFGPDCEVIQVFDVRTNVHVDHRHAGDALHYGENDVEALAEVRSGGSIRKVALLVENKIDAPVMDRQGHRYNLRGKLRQTAGEWTDFRCIFIAPAARIRQLYPLSVAEQDGWHKTFSFEELSSVLATCNSPETLTDAQLLLDATLQLNHFNEPIPEAVAFWNDYREYAASEHPDVPVSVKTEAGSRAGGVWPSFFENCFRKNSDKDRRKVQIVHVDNASRVVLFVKNVRPKPFQQILQPLIEPGIRFSKPGTSWQGIMIEVGGIDPRRPLQEQRQQIAQVFEAARRLMKFFDDHQSEILSLIVAERAVTDIASSK